MISEYIGIRQFFTRQTFPNPDLSKFSTVKNLRHTVCSKILSVTSNNCYTFCVFKNFLTTLLE